jgi:hypothetical protein
MRSSKDAFGSYSRYISNFETNCSVSLGIFFGAVRATRLLILLWRNEHNVGLS